jgi:hypothetical protein
LQREITQFHIFPSGLKKNLSSSLSHIQVVDVLVEQTSKKKKKKACLPHLILKFYA